MMIDCKTCKYEEVCEIPDFVKEDMKSCKTYTQKKSFTNADRIQNMSISDLASFLCKVKADYQWKEQEFPAEDEVGEWEEWLNEILNGEEQEMGFKESGEGLLLKLPCKVDDIIWDNSFGSPCSYKVTGFSYGDLSNDDYDYEEMPNDELIVHYRDRSGCITGSFPVSEIGEAVFFTRKEAAEKRKEMEDKESNR